MEVWGDVDVSLDVSAGSGRDADGPGVAAPDPETPRGLPSTGGVLEPFMSAAVVAVALAALVRRLLGRLPHPTAAVVPATEEPTR